MSKTKATKTADRATDLYSAARANPYVQRLMEDEELRDNLREALEKARGAYTRATGNGKGAVKACRPRVAKRSPAASTVSPATIQKVRERPRTAARAASRYVQTPPRSSAPAASIAYASAASIALETSST